MSERERLVHESSHFDISAEELSDLFDPKNDDKLKKLGGVKELCKKVRVNPSEGLSNDEGSSSSDQAAFGDRQEHFGRNVLPEPPTKSFLQLLWAAYNDKTLIMLT